MTPRPARRNQYGIHPQKEFVIASSADDVWDAVRDFGAVHTRLAPGFVTDAVMDGDARLVTFSNGTNAREILVDCDDTKRRLVYAIVSERIRQHSALRCRFTKMATSAANLSGP